MNRFSVNREFPVDAEIGKIFEISAVDDAESSRFCIDFFKFYFLRQLFEFIKPRMRRSVRPDHSVRDEIVVGRLVAEVAAVAPARPAVFFSGADAVIKPLPDETSLETGIFLKCFEILFKSAVAVSHGMSVFAHDHRARVVGDFFRPFRNAVDMGIHRADDIGEMRVEVVFPAVGCSFVMHGTRRIIMADPAFHCGMVWTDAGFISK